MASYPDSQVDPGSLIVEEARWPWKGQRRLAQMWVVVPWTWEVLRGVSTME